MTHLETDYLVVGAGAAALAFTNSLVAHGDADVVLVDRRDRPGGHWNDAYPFVRLHQPSAFYGMNSRVLGADAIDTHGPNAGFYERATGAEICDYFGRVLDDHLLPTGRVRFVPVSGLTAVAEPVAGYVLIGGGKTAMDACIWLLERGVEADRIQWVRPRDSWLLDRAGWQPLTKVTSIFEGISLELEALAHAESVDDLLARLEACGRLLRLDESVTPTMYRCATVSTDELAQLRTDRLHVDCSVAGLRVAPARPIFEADRLTLQQVRYCSPTFNAALIGYVEATRTDLAEQNHLCPPNPYPDAAEDWLRNYAIMMEAAGRWLGEPDLVAWLEGSRLNILRGVLDHADEPRLLEALDRYQRNLGPALANVARLQEATPVAGV